MPSEKVDQLIDLVSIQTQRQCLSELLRPEPPTQLGIDVELRVDLNSGVVAMRLGPAAYTVVALLHVREVQGDLNQHKVAGVRPIRFPVHRTEDGCRDVFRLVVGVGIEVRELVADRVDAVEIRVGAQLLLIVGPAVAQVVGVCDGSTSAS